MKASFGFLDTVWLMMVIFRPVSSTSGGAPPSTCTEMTPWHNSAPSTSPCPFKLTANVPCFQPGQRILLLLQDPLGQMFKGLMVQARLNGSAQPQSVGKFDLNGNKDLKFLNCFGSDSDTITHSNSIPKQYKEFGWTAPDVFQGGSMDFTYTVVQSYTIFWVKNIFNLPFCASNVDFTKLPNTSDSPISQNSLASDQPHTSTYPKNDETVGTETASGNDVTTGGFDNTNQDFHSPFTNSSFIESVTSPILRTVESVQNTSNTRDPSQTNQDFSIFSGTVASSILETVESIQNASTVIAFGQTNQYSHSPVTNSSLSEAVTIPILQTLESEENASTSKMPQTDQQFSEVAATLPSVINSTPTPKYSSFLSQLLSTTTTSLQVGPCVDSGPECKNMNMNKCYNHVIKIRCCLSCTKLQSSNPEGCEYGDKISICGYYRQPTFCRYYKDECCASCRDVV